MKIERQLFFDGTPLSQKIQSGNNLTIFQELDRLSATPTKSQGEEPIDVDRIDIVRIQRRQENVKLVRGIVLEQGLRHWRRVSDHQLRTLIEFSPLFEAGRALMDRGVVDEPSLHILSHANTSALQQCL
jgi:hypothetical protein